MKNTHENLVQKLREAARRGTAREEDMMKAADHIDTLTAENAALRRTNDTLHKDWSEVNAENERYRKALQEIVLLDAQENCSRMYELCDAADVARAALTPTDTKGKRDGQAD